MKTSAGPNIEDRVKAIMTPFAKPWRWFCDGPWIVLEPPQGLIAAETLHHVHQRPDVHSVEAVFRATPSPGVYLRFRLHDLPQESASKGVAWTTSTATPTELLVLSGHGMRVGVLGHYGLFDETPDLAAAIKVARVKLAEGHARAFVAYRIEAAVIDGIGDGTDRELVRFEIYPDRVALVPANQGGLSDEQKVKAHTLPRKGLL